MLHYVIDLNDLKKTFKKRVVIDKRAILVTWLAEHVYAIQDKCPHMGASLHEGSYDEGIVECRKHGAQFNVKNGEVVKKAQIGFIKMPTKKPTLYKTVVEDGKVYIDL